MKVALPSEVSSENTAAENPISVIEVWNSNKFQKVQKINVPSIKWFKVEADGCFISKCTVKHKMN